MAMEGFFELRTPHDLLQKLEREYAQWKANPLNVDLAWNFFVTAEHLPDWLGRTNSQALGGRRIEDFKRDQPITRICHHLANGGKHFRPNPKWNTSVARTVRENTGWVEPGWIEEGWVGEEPALRVYLTPKERTELKLDSEDIDALWLAARIMEFWQVWPALRTGT